MIAAPPTLPPSNATMIIDKVSIVVLNWNAAPFLERALSSIVRHTREPYEIVLVDNGSTDGSKEKIRDFAARHHERDLRIVDHAENLYFSRGMNTGMCASAADARYVVLFCNDVEVKRDDWLDSMLTAIRTPGAVAAGHAEVLPVTEEQRTVFRRNEPSYDDPEVGRRMHDLLERAGATYSHLYGYCFLLDRVGLERAGLYLEEGDFRQYHSDWEWYMRFQELGLRVVDGRPGVHHWHSISELIELYPHRYRELLERLRDEETVARYLREGRPLFEEESGYRAARQEPARDE